MKVIGLTGQTGAGKSYVADILLGLGCAVVDADVVAREVMAPGSECLAAVAGHFGSDIILPDGSCDRRLLAQRAFADEESTKLLSSLTHPYIIAKTKEYLRELENKNYSTAVFDAPQLFESGGDKLCDVIVSVTAPAQVRLERIMTRDGITREQALLRMNAQKDEQFYTERSGYVIDGSQPAEKVEENVRAVFAKIRSDGSKGEGMSRKKKKEKNVAARIMIVFGALSLAALLTLFIALVIRVGNEQYTYSSYPVKYASEVEAAAKKYGVSKYLIYAVIKAESDFDPEAESRAGAVGLMQIMPVSFEWIQEGHSDGHDPSVTFEDLRDPALNIDYGTHLLSILIDMYGNEETAVCAYNGGLGNVNSWLQNDKYSSDGKTLDIVPFEETDNYRSRVMRYESIYRRLYGSADDELYLDYPRKYREYVEAAAKEYNVDKNLIYGVIKTESNFDPEAESPVGALGLMQIMPVSFDWICELYGDDHEAGTVFEDMKDPKTNIEYGTHMLSILIDMYGDEETAVCAYNGGIGNVNSWLENKNYSSDGKTLDVVPYEETDNYRKSVMGSKGIYEELYGIDDSTESNSAASDDENDDL